MGRASFWSTRACSGILDSMRCLASDFNQMGGRRESPSGRDSSVSGNMTSLQSVSSACWGVRSRRAVKCASVIWV